MTAFQVGDRVRYTGMPQVFEVTEVDVRSTPFGEFVTYAVAPVAGGEAHHVVNAHVRMERVA